MHGTGATRMKSTLLMPCQIRFVQRDLFVYILSTRRRRGMHGAGAIRMRSTLLMPCQIRRSVVSAVGASINISAESIDESLNKTSSVSVVET